MSSLRIFISAAIIFFAVSNVVAAQASLTALARLGPEGANIEQIDGATRVSISLTRPVPWRVFTLDDPKRLVVEFSELAWGEGPSVDSPQIKSVRTGLFRPGWSRMVAVLNAPLAIRQAEMVTAGAGSATLILELALTTDEAFTDAAGAPVAAKWPRNPIDLPQTSLGKPVVVIDPGHGGIDPGAELDGLIEADLMLDIALSIKEALLRTGAVSVVLTRPDDRFVPLEERVTLARAAGATLFLSLHADALELDAGPASGMAVYTLSDEGSDLAAQRLFERHAQDDILAGVDLSGAEDEIAFVLMDLMQRQTIPRSERLAQALIDGFASAKLAVNSRPHRKGGFSVLKSADFPSVLIELGFLSSDKDRARLTSNDWRISATDAISNAIMIWLADDAALRN